MAFFTDEYTRTTATESDYIKRVESMMAQYGQATGNVWEDNLVQAIHWILDQRGEWSKATWRYKRAALLFYFQDNLMVRNELDNVFPFAPRSKKRPRTSAKKLKRLPLEDFLALKEFAEKSKKSKDDFLMLWLSAGLISGLRPSEWEHAWFDSDISGLVVRNGKATNGRGLGETRTLFLPNDEPDILQTVLEFLYELRELLKNKSFKRVYDSCRNRLYYIGLQIWPKRKERPTLYSCRHQFAADAKVMGFSHCEIAAFMGHAASGTAGTHYARKEQGHGGIKISTDPEAVERVRATHVKRYRTYSNDNSDSGPSPQ